MDRGSKSTSCADQNPITRYWFSNDSFIVENPAPSDSDFLRPDPLTGRLHDSRELRHESTDREEELDNHTMTRMLEDPTGRLLFVGDASNISFLQLLRMVVETAASPSAFTLANTLILLTRPFFLFLVSADIQRTHLHGTHTNQEADRAQQRKQRSGKIKQFSNACLLASNQIIALVQNAYEGSYLPQQDPFSVYILFSAALIVFAHEFVWLFEQPSSFTLYGQFCDHP